MDLQITKTILEPFLKEHDLIFYDVELVKEFGYLILRVTLDKKGGIDVDTLGLANEYLSERIDKYDSDMPEYLLEVSSPGAEKVLRNDEEILESIGMYTHVEVENMIYEGELVEADPMSITLRINIKGRFKKMNIKKEEIKLIRLAVKI
ncbi:ribosome maturation factor RimP [Anaeroplasma bactoclasticum]|jgi:ribosome maturation factor RimP|uniref:Ribosome maturation factor RimP n=1 Tax=Anaeroplasma bactoclasticum TaxID=2088 RepID=A0A397RXK9_9MOLU|nr:ribosome maturation factor RimP [Anaeroplasma bactoclasticum]RIA78002.1 ribosome maturation factor RimP [Anaeroplasma bactoclasticum]